MKHVKVSHNIPASVLEDVRHHVQPRAGKKRHVPVAVIVGNCLPIMGTVDGRTHAVVGRDYLCGQYYD